MEIFLYLLFSSLEWLALVILTFAMFRFPLRGYWGQILLTSFVLSLLSHLVFKELDMRVLATLLQPPVVFLFFWQVFRIHVFYASLMTVYGYLGYLSLQLLILILMRWLGIPLEIMVPDTTPMYVLQGLTILIVLMVASLLYRYRIGYSFVPDSEYAQVKLQNINLRIFILILVGYITLSIANFVAYTSSLPVLLLVIVAVTLGILLYSAQRKEYARD